MGHRYRVAASSRLRGPHWQWEPSRLWRFRLAFDKIIDNAKVKAPEYTGPRYMPPDDPGIDMDK